MGKILLLAAFFVVAHIGVAEARGQESVEPPITVRITQPDQGLEARDSFFLELARQSLEMALPEEAFSLELRAEPMRLPQQRMLRTLQQGDELDLTWTMTSAEREARMLPVRLPLLKGLAGYRVLVVRSQDRDRFANMQSAKDFAGLTGGQLQDWPDIDILRANNLEQISALTLDQLYQLLRAGRIDYVLRGITEVAIEQQIYDFSGLETMRSPVLRYPAPIYFFVTPQRPELAELLGYGLRKLHQSGGLEQLHRTHPNTAPWFSDASLWQDRHFIDLENPDLKTPSDWQQTNLWFNPEALVQEQASGDKKSTD